LIRMARTGVVPRLCYDTRHRGAHLPAVFCFT
jgi:hypothetical protein